MSTELRVLIAEDDPHIRDGLRELLESEGYDVDSAADGDEALAFWEETGPDLIILDVMMPKKKRLRRLPYHTQAGPEDPDHHAYGQG